VTELPALTKPLGAALGLAILWMLEGSIPMFEGRRGRGRHDASNIALGLLNAGVTALTFAAATLFVTEWARGREFGLLHLLALPGPVRLAVAIVIFDLWQYLWHRLNHRLPFLWRFHAVHHSDRDLDATTALRFHTGEIILSSTARLAVLPLLGLTVGEVLVYETILLPIVLFHHSNVRVPGGLDRCLRWLIVTPWMHWVHHSDFQPETDSNYSSVFSVWDRIFGSFRLRTEPRDLTLGLRGMERSEWATLRGMLVAPFRPRGGPPGDTDPPQDPPGDPDSG
jgi:sterol desaturase/sphingolipid hydroxylase (fatty acid hydroxylase superfamily)